MAVNDVYLVQSLAYHGPTTNCHVGVNTTYWQVFSLTGGGVTDQEIATGLDGTWAGKYLAIMSANARWRGVRVQRILPTLGTEFHQIGSDAPGDVAGDLLASQCGLIRKVTVLGGRANRGRIYVPFPSEAANAADGSQTVGYLASLADLRDVMAGFMTIVGVGGTGTLVQVLFHRADSSVTRVDDLVPQVGWATQRRRMLRGRARPIPF